MVYPQIFSSITLSKNNFNCAVNQKKLRFIALRRRRLGRWGLWFYGILSGRYKEVLGFGCGNWGQEKCFWVLNLTTKWHYSLYSIQHTLLTSENNRSLSGSSPPHLPPLSLSHPLSYMLWEWQPHMIFLFAIKTMVFSLC